MSFHVTSMPMGRRSTVLLLICGLASIGLVWVSDVIAFLKMHTVTPQATSSTSAAASDATSAGPAPDNGFVAGYSWQNDKFVGTKQPTPSSNYWLQNIARNGSIPYAQYSRFNQTSNSTYQIFRNVRDFGAYGDGTHDDTAAIQQALNGTFDATSRCGQGCDSSTTTPAIVYFPAGTYLVSSTIVMYYYTQLIGDATNLPILKGTAKFSGLGLLEPDPYSYGGASWFTNQNNFYRQVRNFVIDMTDTPNDSRAIHWQVSQATSLQNIVFNLVEGSQQTAVWMDNGSSTFFGDLIINGGGTGMFCGNQQYTIRNVTFNNVSTGIYQNWGWVWLYKNLVFNNVDIGLDISQGGDTGTIQVVGSVAMQDSVFINSRVGVYTTWTNDSTPTSAGALVLDNVDMRGTQIAVNGSEARVIVPGNTYIKHYLQGEAFTSYFNTSYFVVDGVNKTCLEPGATGIRLQQLTDGPDRPDTLTRGMTANDLNIKNYPTRFKPQYEDVDVSQFISTKANGCVGDGVADDTACIQNIITNATPDQVIYFDHGAYVIRDIIKIPPNRRITGEIWPMIMVDGSSPTFSDINNPQPAIQVGQPDDIGMIEMSDLVFETLGPAPGAIMVQWNIEGTNPGDAGMWDVHWRIGGTAGTKLQADTCLKNPDVSHASNPNCIGSFMLLHITSTGSVYMENNWGWVADHELDMNPYIGMQIDIYNGRGVLIEGDKGNWLVGTGFEHSALYNYQVANANNVYMGAIQAETAYMQDNPNALDPFLPTTNYSDPFFNECTGAACFKTYGLIVSNSNNVFVYGAGLYSFFDNYDQGCLITENCQQFMIQLDNSSEVYLYNAYTKASANVIAIDGVAVVSSQGLMSSFCQGVVYFEEP